MADKPALHLDTPWKEPLHDPGPAVVFDIDGVLADMRRHEHLITAEHSREKKKQQWKEFHRRFDKAAPIKSGLITANRIYDELDIDLAYSTTRPEQHARRTLRWFEKHDVPMGPILFRHFVRDGSRPAVDVKLRHWWYWQRNWAEQNPVLAWIEDDPASMHALRAHGCPAWGPNELKAAARKSSLKAALEAGPEDWNVLAQAKRDSYKQWRIDEDEWQAMRKKWWQDERQRQREQRAAARNPRRQGGR